MQIFIFVPLQRNEDEVNDDTFCDILDSGALDGFQLDLDSK